MQNKMKKSKGASIGLRKLKRAKQHSLNEVYNCSNSRRKKNQTQKGGNIRSKRNMAEIYYFFVKKKRKEDIMSGRGC